VAADWFGSLVPSPTNLFGGLNPKQPDAFSNIPVGAVFNWEDSKQSEALLPFGSLYGETDYYNYDISNNMEPMVESREKQGKEVQAVSNNNNSISDVDTTIDVPKVKQEKPVSTDNTFLRIKFEKPEKSKAKKGDAGEKKKRGRPRLNTGQEPLSPMYVDLDDVNLSARALTDHPISSHQDESLVTIGSYSKAIRRAKIERFKAKKLHNLQFGPHLRFAFRKQFAGARPRVGGRFIKLHSDPFLGPPPPVGVDSDSDMMLSRDELLSDDGNTSGAEDKFFFNPDSERDAMNLAAQQQQNDPYFNDLVNQYAALWRPEPHMFAPFPFSLNVPFPAQA